MKDILLARTEELLNEVNASIENYNRLKTNLDNATHAHNALVGRFEEAKSIYKAYEENEAKKLTENYVAE